MNKFINSLGITVISSIVAFLSTISIPFLLDEKAKIESIISIDKKSINCTPVATKVKCNFSLIASQTLLGYIDINRSKIIDNNHVVHKLSSINSDDNIDDLRNTDKGIFTIFLYENIPTNIYIEFNDLNQSISNIAELNIPYFLSNGNQHSINVLDITVRSIN